MNMQPFPSWIKSYSEAKHLIALIMGGLIDYKSVNKYIYL